MASLKSVKTSGQYSVAWITALPVEQAASTAMLDEVHEVPYDFQSGTNDLNTYTCGSIGGHNVVISSMLGRQYGTSSVGAILAKIPDTFPNIKIALLVGIGSGVPRYDRDIRLGDIVVSQPTGLSGGVVQYDLGKNLASQEFSRTGMLSPPPRVLLSALSRLRARHELEGSEIPRYLENMLKKWPKMGRGENAYVHQGYENDILFDSDHKHVGGFDCRACDARKAISRQARNSTDPEVHYGLIASGNALIKDAATRDKMVSLIDENILCFEMEAAGLIDTFPCLVIRGICDYADSHKNKQWQRYASATAAAYAKELLSVMSSRELRTIENSAMVSRVLNDLNQITNATYLAAGKTSRHAKTADQAIYQKELREWLAAPDPSTNFHKALNSRHHGSCSWLLQDMRYCTWKTSPNSFLWLLGIPGCGKTVLASTVIEDLIKDCDRDDAVLYFYFDFSDISKMSFESMLRCLIFQLYEHQQSTQMVLDSFYSRSGNGQWSLQGAHLRLCFLQMLDKSHKTWIVLDAIDECLAEREGREDLLDWIHEMGCLVEVRVSLLATSRKEPEIESSFQNWIRPNCVLPVQERDITDDIASYIHRKVTESGSLTRWRERPQVLKEIETLLIAKAGGTFRWVACQIDSLEQCLDYSSLQRVLKQLPTTLDETYSRILTRIDPENRKAAITILQLLVFSKHPLRLEDALDAIAVTPEREPYFDPRHRMPVPKEITRYCPDLVILTTRKINPGNEYFWYNEDHQAGRDQRETADRHVPNTVTELQLAHGSVKEYLTSNRVHADFELFLKESDARASLAKISLAYLSHLSQELPEESIKARYPFALYCARYWMTYAVHSEETDEVLQHLIDQFLTDHTRYQNWLRLFDPEGSFSCAIRKFPERLKTPPLYYFAFGGLKRSVQLLISRGADVNAEGGLHGSSLQAACFRGHSMVAELLLLHGADINANGGLHGGALQAACFRGHFMVAKLLLLHGADINANGGLHGGALQAACVRGHFMVAKLLLERGAVVNAQSPTHNNSLLAACWGGHEQVVRLLLEHGADVSAGIEHDYTRLHTAAGSGANTAGTSMAKRASMDILLEEQGLVQAASLIEALQEEGEDTVRFISDGDLRNAAKGSLTLEADSTLPYQHGGRPLHAAVSSPHSNFSIVRLLLEHGAEPNVWDSRRLTPLQIASERASESVVELLLTAGADVRLRNDEHDSALHSASRLGKKNLVITLLEASAELDLSNGKGETPINLSCQNGHLEVVKLLLEQGANLNKADHDGWTPLHSASARGHAETVQVLYQNGADINVVTIAGWTPLNLASANGHVDVGRFLVKIGADLDLPDLNGWTPLHSACQIGSLPFVTILAEAGANVDAITRHASTPLDTAVKNGHIAIAHFLARKGGTLSTAANE